MMLKIGEQDYWVDTDELMQAIHEDVMQYVDPTQPKARKYTPERIGIKSLLKLRYNEIVQSCAAILGVTDWRGMLPGRHDDSLVVLTGHVEAVVRAFLYNAGVELEATGEQFTAEGRTVAKLKLARAAIGPLRVYGQSAAGSGESRGVTAPERLTALPESQKTG